MKTQFRDLIESSPNCPGIYKMFAADGTLLYVGKARNISARLKQYLDISRLEPHKQIMRTLVSRVGWETTPDEASALILEQKLIKTEKPKYNIMLTDGKMYPMLALTNSPFPRLLKFRGRISQKRDVFGPYPSVSALNETIKTIQKVCGLRTCTDTFMRNRTRPCLLYQIGRCSAPCMIKLEYSRAQSAGKSIELRVESLDSSKTEQNSVILNNNQDLESLNSKLSTLKSSSPCGMRSYTHNVKLARRILTGDVAPVVKDLSVQMQSASDALDFETAAILRDKISALTETSVRGIRNKKNNSTSSIIHHPSSIKDLEQFLDIKINRAAVFDNSHLFGKSPVGAMIVFGPDGFVKSEYRHFKLKDMARAGNDIAMMDEFISRAVAKAKFDLIIVDGGRAQWNAAKKIAPGTPILGIVKGVVRDGDESFILPNGKTIHHSQVLNTQCPMPNAQSPIPILLRAVRDEAHRFAISFHRVRRAKQLTASVLDEIDGIGPARKRAVLHHFGSTRAIADATLAALLKVPTLGKSAAQKIYNHFH